MRYPKGHPCGVPPSGWYRVRGRRPADQLCVESPIYLTLTRLIGYPSISRLPTGGQVFETPIGLRQSILLASVRIGYKDISMPGIFRGIIHQPITVWRPGSCRCSAQRRVGKIDQVVAIGLDRVQVRWRPGGKRWPKKRYICHPETRLNSQYRTGWE